ncbi:MAG: pyridoxamine 5'-phosphate oxidase family protein [Planctomycetota bacterium]
MTSGEDPRAGLGSLDAVLNHAWTQLGRALHDKHHGWRTPALATIDAQGRPAVRTVVLRQAHPPGDHAGASPGDILKNFGFLAVNTDPRSPKWAHLAERPWASWCFWDGRRDQLRVEGPITLHQDDEVADEAWRSTSPNSLRVHLAPEPPGASSDRPTNNLPQDIEVRAPTQEELDAARGHFGLVRCRAVRMDFLRLHRDRALRAGFAWDESGKLTADWRAP